METKKILLQLHKIKRSILRLTEYYCESGVINGSLIVEFIECLEKYQKLVGITKIQNTDLFKENNYSRVDKMLFISKADHVITKIFERYYKESKLDKYELKIIISIKEEVLSWLPENYKDIFNEWENKRIKSLWMYYLSFEKMLKENNELLYLNDIKKPMKKIKQESEFGTLGAYRDLKIIELSYLLTL